MHYIYLATNLINNKIYIGQTKNPYRRFIQHKHEAMKENPIQYFHRAIKKYGFDNFVFDIIANCKNQEDTDICEIQIIKQHNCTDHNIGYNISLGGDGNNKLDDITEKEIIKLYLAKQLKVKEIAKKCNVKIDVVYRTLQSNNIAKRGRISIFIPPNKLNQQIEQNIILAYQSGTPQETIKIQFNISHQTMNKILKRNNIKSRGREIYGTNKGWVPTEENRNNMSEAAKGKHKQLSSDKEQQIKYMIDNGSTYRQIKQQLKCSNDTITRIIRKEII